MANHFSVGARDGVGNSPSEIPEDQSTWSVPGKTIGASDTPYGIGTTSASGCHDPSGNVTVDENNPQNSGQEAQAATEAHGFCGMLIYHEGTGLEQTSPPDQDMRGPIGSFDVIRANSIGSGVTPCLPFCPDGEGQPDGGQEAFDAAHEVGSTAGLTDGPDDANDKEPSSRERWHAVNVHYADPGRTVQESTDVWEMNGWWVPTWQTTFIATLTDDNGNFIDDDRLKTIVQNQEANGGLNPNAEPAVCGYTPDFVFTTVTGSGAALNCEFSFNYYENGDNEAKFDGYKDECETPTYVCGANQGPAWYYEACWCVGLADPEIPGGNNAPFVPGSTLGGPEGQTDYIRFHWVVAPHNSECGGGQEPGFSFDTDGSYDHPYLAHEVDVFTTAGSVSDVDQGSSVPEVWDYADAVAEKRTGQAAETLGDPYNAIPDLPVPAETSAAVRDDTLEPNNAQPVGALDDTSRTYEEGTLNEDPLRRDLSGACEKLFAQEEPKTVDPWVDYLDSHAKAVQDVDSGRSYANDERIERRIDLYGSSDDGQDASNRPGPSLYETNGKVGMFADKDDDGEYDALAGGLKYNNDNPGAMASGAYPMVWNVRANDDGTVAKDKGCQVGDRYMSAEAEILGYGVNTGLVQAIYLNEPTAFVSADTDDPGSSQADTFPYPEGNNIYLLMSQAARVQYKADQTDANPLDTQIDELVSELQNYVETNFPERGTPGVQLPGEDIGSRATFQDQCDGPTGNFDSNLQFVHDCTLDCRGDTIATMYTFDINTTAGTLEGSELLPSFEPGGSAYDFGQGQHTWYDVDPFDNNANRNDDAENPPPNPNAGLFGEGVAS